MSRGSCVVSLARGNPESYVLYYRQPNMLPPPYLSARYFPLLCLQPPSYRAIDTFTITRLIDPMRLPRGHVGIRRHHRLDHRHV